MNELQLLRKQEASASRRIHELEQIVGDVSSSIVKRSKAKVELAGLRSHGVHKHTVGLADTGQVTKNKERVEREILRNLERAGREEEIRRLQALLRDENKVKSAERRRELEARLRAAQAAIEALDIEEAEEEKAVATTNEKRRGAPTTQGKISVDVFADEESKEPATDVPFKTEEEEGSVDTPVASNIRDTGTKLNGEDIDEELGRSKDMTGLDITIESGIVAKGTTAAERRIKFNEERAHLQAETVRLRQELRDETDSVNRLQKLIDQLRAAEAALKVLDAEEAACKAEEEAEKAGGSIDEVNGDTKGLDISIEPGIVAKGMAMAERRIKCQEEKARYEAEIKRLRRELHDETESLERIQKLVGQLKAAEAALAALVVEVNAETSDAATTSGTDADADVAVEHARQLVVQYGELDAEETEGKDDADTIETGIVPNRDKERAMREAEIKRLQQELRSVAVFGTAEEMQALMEQLRAAEVALDAIEDASENGASLLGGELTMPSITEVDEEGDVESLEQAKPMVAPGSPRCVSVADVTMQMILEDQNRENAERIRKLEAEIERLRIEGHEKDLLIKHWQDKAATLIRECLSLEVDVEERNWKIRELQDWRKIQDERITTLQSQQLTSQHPPVYIRQGSRRFSTRALSDPSFRATLRRASTHGKTLDEQLQEEATAEVIALEERLAVVDGEREQLLCELETMKSIVKQSYDNCSKGKKKKGRRLIYQLSCKRCNGHRDFIGTTHQDLTTTVNKHIDGVVQELSLKGHADNDDHLENWSPDFVSHFAEHLRDLLHKSQISRNVVTTFCRENVKVEVLRRQDGAELMWMDDSVHTEMADDQEFLEMLSQ